MIGNFATWVIAGVFWIWMIIDCAKRNFRRDVEKIVWLVIVFFAYGFGALVYFIVVKMLNPKGIMRR
jgi:fatty acid desaturase